MKVKVSRKEHFNAAHRLFRADWSDAQNEKFFGKCSNPHYHGHNYEIIVSVTGEPDAETGYVYDMKVLSDLIRENVLHRFDHKNLNLDVPFMAGTIPSTENLVLACWRVLAPAVAPARLAKLKLWETENQYVEYDGR